MEIVFRLIAQYQRIAVILIDLACENRWFHVTSENLVKEVSAGTIGASLVQMASGERYAQGVALTADRSQVEWRSRRR